MALSELELEGRQETAEIPSSLIDFLMANSTRKINVVAFVNNIKHSDFIDIYHFELVIENDDHKFEYTRIDPGDYRKGLSDYRKEMYRQTRTSIPMTVSDGNTLKWQERQEKILARQSQTDEIIRLRSVMHVLGDMTNELYESAKGTLPPEPVV